MLRDTVRSKVLLPLTLTVSILTGSFLYTSHHIRLNDYERDITYRYSLVQHVLKSLIKDHSHYMLSAIEFIADEQRFQDALRNKNRQLLLQHGTAVLKRLAGPQQITHFYFYDQAGELVLRVYDPSNTSASPVRMTRQMAITRGETVSGLELGHNGTFTLRVVYPWKIRGELIGYIELGQEYDHILQELRAITGIDFAVVLDKANLNRPLWEYGMSLLGRPADWGGLADWVISDQTVAIPPLLVSSLLNTGNASLQTAKLATVSNRTYSAKPFPLYDAAQKEVGKFVLFTDLTDEITSFRLFITQIAAFSLLLCSVLFIYSFRILGMMDRRLRESREQLDKELEKKAQTNKQLVFEVGERLQAEADLLKLNQELEQRVLERTAQLDASNQHLEASRNELEAACKNLQTQQATILQQDRMACIGQLAASVAHDINNPIGFVYGNLEVLKNYWHKLTGFIAEQDNALQLLDSPEVTLRIDERRKALKVDYVLDEFNAVLDESLEGAQRVNKIVLNLKGFARLDENEARLADIHECLESTLNIVLNELRYKADIKKEYGDVPQLVCFPQQLNQVFMNLMINAAQAIENWGEITIRTWADQKNVFIAIGDTGCGIPEEHYDRLFEPFFTTKASGVGTGLGLSIVREIIKKHQGEITVDSKSGEWTVITLQLPLEPNPVAHGHA